MRKRIMNIGRWILGKILRRRRVVITGIGLITSLGKTPEENWRRIVAGESRISRITLFDPEEYTCQIAGEVKDFNPEKDLAGIASKKAIRRMDRFIEFGLFVAKQAIQDAELNFGILDRSRIGVSIGVGFIGISRFSEGIKTLLEKGPQWVSPLLIPATLSNLAAGQISILFGLKGINLSITTACAASSHAIGEAFRSIQRGESDIVMAGGVEAPISPISIAGFENMGALATHWNADPEKASRPFDKRHDGFVPGEGAGGLILEELNHALSRKAKIYAEIVGFAQNADAHHITEPTVEGPRDCISKALKDAHVKPKKIGYVNAHATSTPLGDINEARAIAEVFGKQTKKTFVGSTKSMTGHLLGAAGAVEAIFTILALRDQLIPPTINLEESDCDFLNIPREPLQYDMGYAISNSFGFGGTNACIVFRKFE